jgi:hypothetical protein
MLQGETNKTIPLTLMCADGAVMVGIKTRLLCGLIKKHPTLLFFLLNKKALGTGNGEHVTLDLMHMCELLHPAWMAPLLAISQNFWLCVLGVSHVDIDQESVAMHLHQVLP